MPTQFFRVTRAPEAGETTAQEIKHALMDVRDDTEWDVREFTKIDAAFETSKTIAEMLQKQLNACLTSCASCGSKAELIYKSIKNVQAIRTGKKGAVFHQHKTTRAQAERYIIRHEWQARCACGEKTSWDEGAVWAVNAWNEKQKAIREERVE